MFTLDRQLWNDGPPLPDFMGSEGTAGLRVARKHLCSGGGGGNAVGQPPDYSKYISATTSAANTGLDRSSTLYDWAQKSGLDLQSIAKTVGTKAAAAADSEQSASDRLMGEWEKTYSPLYQAQAKDAENMIGDLPAYQEQKAGEAEAGVAQANDAAKATQMRNMRAQGFSPSAVASQAIDTVAGTQRAMATAAAGQTGRAAARTEARDVTSKALTQGQDVANEATTQAGLATGNRNQTVAAPAQAASTSASLYSPSTSMYSAASPYLQGWFNATGTSYNQQLSAAQVNSENSDGGFASTILPLAGGIAGSFLGPLGTAAGSAIGGIGSKAIGGGLGGGSGITYATGGRVPGRRYAQGGAIDTSAPMDGSGSDGNFVPPEASPSGGAKTDDVPAMVNVGEFVVPKRTVDWLGDKFFQKLIQKTDTEIDGDTTAAPEQGPMPAGAMDTSPPMFRSEGARQ